MLHPLKVTSTLADETRYLIYEYMLQQKTEFTVTQIAEKFRIHPNVARLHLTKLAEINVITADYAKTGRGGRPGRVYKATSEGITLTFPTKQDSLMLNWSLQLIEELGEPALEKAKTISYNDGYNSIKAIIHNTPLSIKDKCNILTDSAALFGYVPEIQQKGELTTIIFSIFSCPFQNQLANFSNIACTLHESYLRGQMDALFIPNDFVQIESMVHSCDFCKYEISVPK